MSWDPVYQLVQRIPRGRVLTYGALAKALRLPGGARSAGRAMASTPSGKGIPWHRVVGERGKILIRGPYAMLQKKLLESEGVSLICMPGNSRQTPLQQESTRQERAKLWHAVVPSPRPNRTS
jgi:methylated-DNA-protein-cysteine methyltransferase-like protein